MSGLDEVRLERAAHDVQIAGSDFIVSIERATTADEAIRVRECLGESIKLLVALENLAGKKADRLCGKVTV